jgi:hypothetical protein
MKRKLSTTAGLLICMLTRLRGFAGFKLVKWLKNQQVGYQSLHYRAVAEATCAEVILGGGCAGS